MNCENPNCVKQLTGTWQKKYCSKSCAVSVNNAKQPKRVVSTTGPVCSREQCTSALGSNKLYCSLACQQLEQRSLKLGQWLSTGMAAGRTSYRGHFVREYVLKEQNGSCDICGITQIWNDKHLEFVLDHIDGNSSDDSRNNLRMICPNCDSQLPTYKSRNIGNGRHHRRERYTQGKSY